VTDGAGRRVQRRRSVRADEMVTVGLVDGGLRGPSTLGLHAFSP